MDERICTVDSCENPLYAKGLCSMHRTRMRRFGTTNFVSSLRSPEQRFFAKVDQSGDCWLWTGSVTLGGYGQFHADGHLLAHRWVYEFTVGPIPDGLHIDHLCKTRACVNPDHLDPVSQAVNARRAGGGKVTGAMYRAATACKRGHPFDETNTVWTGNQRRCRACRNESSRIRMARLRREAV